MNEISILTADINNPQIKPMREKLGEKLCKCYSMAAPKNKKKICDPHIELSIFPFLAYKSFKILSKYNIVPMYYAYFSKMKTLDRVFCRKISNDESSVVFLNPLFCKTAIQAKRKGKTVVVVAGNSEPEREHKRIIDEYERYDIKHRYIYGDYSFAKRCNKTFSLADKIISISNVSLETYKSAGYDQSKLVLIPLTGTDFPIHSLEENKGQQKAFITTAYHNFIKGTHRLLLAWKKAKIQEIPLILVGRICEDLQEFIEKNGPFENVIYVGNQSNLKEFYKTFDAVGILLSLSEGAVRVTPEMMSFGFPMITSPDATCDLVENGYNGFIVSPTDENQIIEKLTFFAKDWKRVYAMRQNVLNSVSSRTVKDYAEDVADYLASLV